MRDVDRALRHPVRAVCPRRRGDQQGLSLVRGVGCGAGSRTHVAQREVHEVGEAEVLDEVHLDVRHLELRHLHAHREGVCVYNSVAPSHYWTPRPKLVED